VVRLAGRRSAIPSEGFGLELPAAGAVGGGSKVLAARTGILLGGAILDRLGRGLTSFFTFPAWPPCTESVLIAEGPGGSIARDAADSCVTATFDRGVVKLKGMGTVGVILDVLGVCEAPSGASLPGV
jgi:hypothetical protein